MKFPLSILNEFIDTQKSPVELGEILTNLGIELDALEDSPLPFEGVVVGKVIKRDPHPEADKLCVAQVTDGRETVQVVCGAPNCREGLVTAFAKIGAKFDEGEGKSFKIKKSKLRGVESEGMLCSERELGLSMEDNGIMEFPVTTPLGVDLKAMFGDQIFEVSLTPNLAHCQSVLGIARELSAALGKEVRIPDHQITKESGKKIADLVTVEIRDLEACPRYATRLVQGVRVAPSPDWLKKKLAGCGIRSINNVVDVTNLVLMELGHPLHAFDFAKVQGGKIIVRPAQEGEKFVTLDGAERSLIEGSLLICDQSGPIALAGVMGGANSEVSDETVDVLIESAYFDSKRIRKCSKHLDLFTEASRRFERGTDPNNVLRALDRAAKLIQQLAGGEICSGAIDKKAGEFPKKNLDCRFSRVNKILGTHLAVGEIESIFRSLELDPIYDGKDLFRCSIPTYRCDLNTEIDLIEEVARLYGLDNIGTEKMSRHTSSDLPHAPQYLFEQEMRELLIGQGLQEFLTCDLIGPMLLEVVDSRSWRDEALVKVVNPTSIEQSILRPSMVPGLLQVVKHNVDRGNHAVAGFEVGNVHFRTEKGFGQKSTAGIVLTGPAAPLFWEDGRSREADFFDLKGIVENIFEGARVKIDRFIPSNFPDYHPGRQATINAGGVQIGVIGEIHPQIQRRLDVSKKILVAEIDLATMRMLKGGAPQMVPIPQFPGSDRDWTITLKEEVPIGLIFESVEKLNSKLLKGMELISIYRSEKLGGDRKNVTFNFVYRHEEKTLSHDVIEREHGRIISAVLEKLGTGVISTESN
jgi:phenylalanyl-tRNA synthetase beta chain